MKVAVQRNRCLGFRSVTVSSWRCGFPYVHDSLPIARNGARKSIKDAFGKLMMKLHLNYFAKLGSWGT